MAREEHRFPEVDCPGCHGTMVQLVPVLDEDGNPKYEYVDCRNCKGTGVDDFDDTPCELCNGTGQRTLPVMTETPCYVCGETGKVRPTTEDGFREPRRRPPGFLEHAIKIGKVRDPNDPTDPDDGADYSNAYVVSVPMITASADGT